MEGWLLILCVKIDSVDIKKSIFGVVNITIRGMPILTFSVLKNIGFMRVLEAKFSPKCGHIRVYSTMPLIRDYTKNGRLVNQGFR